MAANIGVWVHVYHTDNGIYHSDEFLKELQAKGQGIKMSGVSAQFQNGAAESIIKSVVQSARTMMLHAQTRWPAVADESLWPQALQYAVYLHNIMPTEETGVSPVEVWTRTKSNHSDLLMLIHGEVQHMYSVPDWEKEDMCPSGNQDLREVSLLGIAHYMPQMLGW